MAGLSAARVNTLRASLEALLARSDLAHLRDRDPVSFVHRYSDPADQEIAGAIAAALAFGKVDLFFPVVARLLEHADLRGGPRRYAETFGPDDVEMLRPLYYRWNRGPDFALWIATLGRAVRDNGRLGALFERYHPAGADTIEEALDASLAELLQLAEEEARRLDLERTRSFRTFLPRPSSGSACKRWNMFLRWMVRPADGVDLGLWQLPATALVLPLDTHTHRIAQYVGLTARNDASWRTAEEITRGLRSLDPKDPVRYDFALAHLGISGQCLRKYRADICRSCALLPVCAFARRALRGRPPEPQ